MRDKVQQDGTAADAERAGPAPKRPHTVVNGRAPEHGNDAQPPASDHARVANGDQANGRQEQRDTPDSSQPGNGGVVHQSREDNVAGRQGAQEATHTQRRPGGSKRKASDALDTPGTTAVRNRRTRTYRTWEG